MIIEEAVFSDGSRGRDHLTPMDSSLEKAQCEVGLQQSLAKVINKEYAFCFRSYSYTPRGITKSQLLVEMNEEVSVIPPQACPSRAHTLVVNSGPYLAIFKLELGKFLCVQRKISMCTILTGCSDKWVRPGNSSKHWKHVLLECVSG